VSTVSGRFLETATRILVFFFRGLTASGRYRKTHPQAFHYLIILLSFGASIYLWRYIPPLFPGLTAESTLTHALYLFLHGLCSFVFTVVMTVFFSALLPLLSYTPHAIEMRKLGLVRCATRHSDIDRLVREISSKEPQSSLIRVICISGRHLFREDEGEKPPPLLNWANSGRLDVVMPATGAHNPTISARWDGYADDFRQANYPTIDILEREVAESRSFLLSKGNKVASHQHLCFWQVVLFSEQCVVQSYFPNSSGRGVNRAPVFLFEKGDEPHSYYSTFDMMFELAKSTASAKVTQAAPVAAAIVALPNPSP
jgi:hypothetical protein